MWLKFFKSFETEFGNCKEKPMGWGMKKPFVLNKSSFLLLKKKDAIICSAGRTSIVTLTACKAAPGHDNTAVSHTQGDRTLAKR